MMELTPSQDTSYAICWNCWDKGHMVHNCPDKRRTPEEQEHLQVQKGIPAPKNYHENFGRKPVVVAILDAATPESVSEDYMTQNFGLSFDAGFTESSLQKYVYPNHRGRRHPQTDTIYQEPMERRNVSKDIWDPNKWIQNIKPPVTLQNLVKGSKVYGNKIKVALFSDDEGDLPGERITANPGNPLHEPTPEPEDLGSDTSENPAP